LIALSDSKSRYVARLEFKVTNNIAEYEGLILRLNNAKASGAKTLLNQDRFLGSSMASRKGISSP